MRLWSIHPGYLDSRGLVALWREGLLALAVARGRTRGYRNHPQLIRFMETGDPANAIRNYLACVHDESRARGFGFDRRKIGKRRACGRMPVSSGQLEYEIAHLLKKLIRRDPGRYESIKGIRHPEPHPLFRKVRGGIAAWERPVAPAGAEGRRSGSAPGGRARPRSRARSRHIARIARTRAAG